MVSILSLFVISLAVCSSRAWQSPLRTREGKVAVEQSTVERRLFLQSVVATTTVSATALLSPMPVLAAEDKSVYVPPPHSMDGKLIVITGGNTGLGLESAKRLAAAGADIILTVRTDSKGQQAVQDIQKYVEEKGSQDRTPSIKYGLLDLASLNSVDSFADQLPKLLANRKIDVLMNNAGVMAIPDRQITVDGYERTFQTNHLGHFALTSKLLSMLSPRAQIINVSSEAYRFAGKGLELDNLQGEREYGPWSSYGQSKLANILFSRELQDRASQAGKEWTVTALHPGAVATDLGRYLVGEEKWNDMKTNGMSFKDSLLFVPLSKLTKTVEQGASTQVYLAVNGGEGGNYYVNTKNTPLSGYPTDPEAAKNLWKVSEDLCRVKFSL